MSCDTCCPSHPDPSKVLQENYCTLVDSIQDADTLADRLYAKGVIADNVRAMVEGCRTAKEKNRVLIAAVQQQVGANPRGFQIFIDVLKMDRSNDTVVSLLIGKEGLWLVFDNNWPSLDPPPAPCTGVWCIPHLMY